VAGLLSQSLIMVGNLKALKVDLKKWNEVFGV